MTGAEMIEAGRLLTDTERDEVSNQLHLMNDSGDVEAQRARDQWRAVVHERGSAALRGEATLVDANRAYDEILAELSETHP